MRSIENQSHDDTCEGTSNWDGHDPGKDKETDSLPVDSLVGSVAKTDTDGGTGDAHRGGDWEGKLGEDEDGDSGSHFHGATSAGRVVCDLVTHNYLKVSKMSCERFWYCLPFMIL